MAQEYRVMATCRNALHDAGRYMAETPEEAEAKAREAFRWTLAGSVIMDYSRFRFYVVWDKAPNA